jgi:hypothetical protein
MTTDTTAELERLLELDPRDAHTKIMEMTRSPPVIVHEEYTGRQSLLDTDNDNDQLPMSTDEMIDAMAQALAETRNDLRTEFEGIVADAMGPLTEQVAVLQA